MAKKIRILKVIANEHERTDRIVINEEVQKNKKIPEMYQLLCGLQVIDIEDDYDKFVKELGGYMEVLRIAPNVAIVCNEDGKIKKLNPNFYIRYPGERTDGYDIIVGNALIVGLSKDGEEFVSLSPITIEKLADQILRFRGITITDKEYE